MIAPAHSPAPFGLVEGNQSWFITDSLGDSIAALAKRTGDHGVGEQLANARLFTAAPDLMVSLGAALAEIDEEIERRKAGGDATCWHVLEAVSNQGWRAIRAARDGVQ